MRFSRTVSNNSDVVGCLGQVRYDIIKVDDLVFGKSSMYRENPKIGNYRLPASLYYFTYELAGQ